MQTVISCPYPRLVTHRRKTVELRKWRKCADAKGEIKKLRGVPTTILNNFMACGRLVVFVAYELALPIVEHREGQPIETARIDMVKSLLLNDSFLDGLLKLRAGDGTVQPFLVPLANRAITNILEIVLLEQQYSQYIFDGSDKWKLRLMNAFSLGGTTCRWGLRQHETGVFMQAELNTLDNARYFEYLTDQISQIDPTKLSYFDALLTDKHFVLTGCSS
ncbi:uncharacterized protein F5147DRAFT_781168 [Suillus discolor]|uniref:Uncharacterized protein n=1 Tax=Suillus discolor TaxID=1912936 RepID=A0A9P7ETV7_9AGAM|nr:uncharacterized protein F5147DRAFT_781168 [Suillus discolor]KAG2087903.1 hypothetical protein F5147DRAFT_781168 [Suillus discolor]